MLRFHAESFRILQRREYSAGILEQSMGARNRVGVGLYRNTRLQRMAKSIPWNRFPGSLKVLNYRLSTCSVFQPGQDAAGSSFLLQRHPQVHKGKLLRKPLNNAVFACEVK
jgi:hypothetical protein